MKIGILGAGAYGMAMASVFDNNGHKIKIWSNSEEEVNLLLTNHKSNKIDYIIPDDFVITTDMKLVVMDADIIVIAVPSEFVRNVCMELNKYFKEEQIICIASKGIENNSCLFMDDVVRQCIKTDNIAIISGGTFAEDMVKEVPVGLTLATKSKLAGDIILKAMENDYVKIQITDDIIGTEICGSIKNVFAIAAGMLEGMKYLESTKSLFMTKVIKDIKFLIKSLGGKEETILSFAGIGDILLTCSSSKSRNYTLGKMIGEERERQEIKKYIDSSTIEGLYTLNSIKKLLKDKEIEMPIINLISDIIMGKKNLIELNNFLKKKV